MTPRVRLGARPPFVDPAQSFMYAPGTLPQPEESPTAVETVLAAAAPLLEQPLNAEQADALRLSFEGRASLLWGPPGTGKTTVLAATVLAWLERAQLEGRPVCVGVGSSNWNAIDHLLEEIADLIERRREIAGEFNPLVRLARLRSDYGDPPSDTRLEDVTRYSDAAQTLAAALESPLQSIVVGGTWQQLSKLAGRRSQDRRTPAARWFNLVIIDEASQVRVASAAAYFLLLKENGHVVLAGDDRQLGPIYAFEVQDTAGGLFDCAFTYMDHTLGVTKTKLVQNYRTNLEIADWPKERFYEGTYEAVSPRQRLTVTLPQDAPDGWPQTLPWSNAWLEILDPTLPVAVVTYPAGTFTVSNPFEAQLVAAIATLYRLALGGAAPADPIFWRSEVGIVTPHRGQVSQIRNLLKAQGSPFQAGTPAVDTVDRFQGQQRSMVLSSYGVADRDFVRAEEKFILDPRRFNVTLTRARAKFVMVISDALVQHLAADADVARHAAHLQLFVQDYCGSVDSALSVPYFSGGTVREMRCRLRGRR